MHRARLCDRPGCGKPATAALAFQYAQKTVWLGELGEPEPSTMELCALHADRVRVPLGWTGQDLRLGNGSAHRSPAVNA